MMTSATKRAAIATAMMLIFGGAAGCKKKGEDQAAEGSGSGSAVVKQADELATAEEPAGLTWKRIDMPFGSLELPVDAGWNLVGTDVQGPDGIVIVMQSQDKDVERMDKFLSAFNALQKRDAPKYEGKPVAKGTVNGEPAARVEGTFDNGTRFVTRDYLVFTKGKVVVVGARIPEAHAAKLPGVVDHLARTLQVK
jgi:hypothetical protein